MSALLATIVVSTALLGQPEATGQDAVLAVVGEVDASTQELIERAIAELGNDRFIVRKLASQQLWRLGLAAEPALRRAAKSRDREVRARAQNILDDFDFGIVPGVPANVLMWIRQFRDGDPSERQEAFATLLSHRRFDIVESMLRLERDPSVRRALLVQLFDDDNAVDRFFELDRVETLIKTVGADQDERWRRTMMASVLATPRMLTRLIETGKLNTLLEFIEKEDDAVARKQLLLTVLRAPGSVAALIKNQQLDFAFTTLMAEKDKSVRGELLLVLLAAPDATAAILEQGKLDQVLTFAKENSDSAVHKRILEQLFRTPNVVARLLEKPGLDPLVEMVRGEQEPQTRGELLANLMMSRDMQKHLTTNGQDDFMITLAKEETELLARRAYLDRLFQYGNILYSLKSLETLQSLWAIVKADPDDHWRTVAISRMLVTSRVTQLFDDGKEIKWLLDWLNADQQHEHRGKLLVSILNNYSLKRKFLQDGHFDKLFAMVKREPEATRGGLLTQLLSSSDASKYFDSEEKAAALIALAAEFTDAKARTMYLTGLFRNHWAMAQLIKQGHYAELAKLAKNADNAVDRAIMFGDFVRTQPVIEQLTKNGELDSLIKMAADEQDQDAKYEFLKRLYSNSIGLGALIDAGHFETLLKLAENTAQPDRRNTLLVDFYSASRVVAALISGDQIESLLAFIKSQQDVNARRQVLQRLFYNQQAIGALVDKGQFETLLTLATSEKHPSYRASMVGALLGSPPVVKYLTNKERLGSVLNLVTREPDASSREQLLTYILSRSATVTALVENGFLPALLKLIDQSEGSRREQLLGQVLLVPKVLELLAEQKRLSMVLAVVATSSNENGRTSYLQRLFYNSTALTLLINHGYFDDLLDLTLSQKQPTFRAQLLGRLFALDLATQQLVKNNRVDFFLTTLKSEASADARRNLLTQLIRSKSVMSALIESKQIDVLITLCQKDEDDAKRRALLSELLASPEVLAHLAAASRLETVLDDVLAETDQAKLRPLLETLFTSSESMRLMAKHNQTSRLITLLESGLDGNHRKALLNRLANNQSGVEWLARAGKAELLMTAINETSSARRGYLLRNVLYTGGALQALLEGGHFDELLKFVRDESNDSVRRSMISNLLFSSASLEYLAGKNQLAQIFKEVTKEADDNLRRQCIHAFLYRTEGQSLFGNAMVAEELLKLVKLEPQGNQASFVRQIMAASRIRQGVVQAGKADVLREFAALEPDAARRRTYLEQLLFAPAGVVAWHLQRGEYEQVEALLAEHAEDDRGRIRIATYLRSRGLLDARVAAMQEQFESEPAQVDQRQLLYLLRAQGNLPAAQALADALDDDGLRRAILVERQAWETAAALQSAAACPLPVPLSSQAVNTAVYDEVETLGYLATFQRLEGQHTEFDETIGRILQLQKANSTDRNLAWHCAEALLLNDRVDAALEFLVRTHPRRAFALFAFQQRFEEAFKLVRLPRGTTPDRAWYDLLPSDGSDEKARSLDRFDFALHIARVLNLLGETGDRDTLLAVLVTYVEEMPESTKSTSPANAYWEAMSLTLMRMGMYPQAWGTGARAVTSTTISPSLLSRLYARRSNEAGAWWRFLRAQQPHEPIPEALDRLHRILEPRPTEAAGEFTALAKQAELHAESLSGASQQAYLLGIAATCRERGETAIALRSLQGAGSYNSATMQRADLLAQQDQHLEAARLYEKIWEDDNEQLAALYLSGHFYDRAGRGEEASRHQQLANELALESRARHTLASGLAERGFLSEAIEQWQFLLAAAPFEHWELNDAARRLALAQPDQPEVASKRWLHYLLGDLRNEYYMLENEGYLRVPCNVHRFRALAAVQAGDMKAALHSITLAAALTPADTTLAEELVPAFEMANQPAPADQVFDLLYRGYAENCRQFPRSAYLHNNLAWLAARCGRRLGEAMKHAEKAVELEPEHGGYVDTLAEVCFRRGDREAAVQHAKRAVQLSPDSQSLRKQLERFSNDPLP